MNELALFAGAGGGIIGGKMLGWRTVCAVEIEPYAAGVLLARQNDGSLPAFPVWDDVCTFDGKPWRGIVDVISGGFPCQDISAAGSGAGIDGERSGLWREFARIICEIRPRFVFIENSPRLVFLGLDRILCDLAAMGFDARWGVISAASVGAPSIRERMWIVANSDSDGLQGVEPESGYQAFQPRWWDDIARMGCEIYRGELHSIPEPFIVRAGDGVAGRVDRTKAIGNGQVPLCAAHAWRVLTGLN